MNMNLRKTCRRTVFLAVALTLPLAPAAAPFSNGGFELPGVPSGSNLSISDGSNPLPTEWSKGGTAAPYAMFYENNTFGVIGYSGPNMIGFGGNSTTGASLSQTFDTISGQTYTVDYFVTSQQGAGVQSLLIQGLNGDAVLGFSTDVIPNYLSTELYHWFAGPSLAFTATGTSSTIRFTDTSDASASSGTNWALDGVSVSGSLAPPIGGTVPEPASLALLGIGLAGLGATRRRKQMA